MQLGHETRVGLRSRRQGEILIVAASGLLTKRDIDDVRSFVTGLLSEQDARAVVLDLRKTLTTLDDAGWRHVAIGLRPTPTRRPLALVVSPALHERVSRACMQATEEALKLRVAFTDFSQAAEWASQRRQHWPWRPPRVIQSCPVLQGCSQWRSVQGCSPCAFLPA